MQNNSELCRAIEVKTRTLSVIAFRLLSCASHYGFRKSSLLINSANQCSIWNSAKSGWKFLRDKQWFSQFNFALMTVSSYLNCSTKLAVLKFCRLSIFDANVFQINAVEQFWNFASHAFVARKQIAIQIWQFSDHCVNLLLFCSFRERKLNPTF